MLNFSSNFSGSDVNFCSKETRIGLHDSNCSENYNYEPCGEVPNALYQNFGCKQDRSETYAFFQCSNRKDKEKVMFKQPVIFVKKRDKTLSLNTILNFTETSINCGGDVGTISYHEAFEFALTNPSALCNMKNGGTLTLTLLGTKLLEDFSFKETEKLDYNFK